MTKKHFNALAVMLRSTRPDIDDARRIQWENDVHAVAKVCGDSNSNFDYARFLKACQEVEK